MSKTKTGKSTRKTVKEVVSSNILIKSGRRCCLCYFFDDDKQTKDGQIAHIDRDPANNTEDNLAYLCLDHHNEYDSTPSQSKGLTSTEIKFYKRRLYKALGIEKTQWRLKFEGTVDEDTYGKRSIRVRSFTLLLP